MGHPKRQLLFVFFITTITTLILDCLQIYYLPKGESTLPSSTQDLCSNAAIGGPNVSQSSVNKLPLRPLGWPNPQ